MTTPVEVTFDTDEVRTTPVPHRYIHGLIRSHVKFQVLLPVAWNGKVAIFTRGFSGTELSTGAFQSAAIRQPEHPGQRNANARSDMLVNATENRSADERSRDAGVIIIGDGVIGLSIARPDDPLDNHRDAGFPAGRRFGGRPPSTRSRCRWPA